MLEEMFSVFGIDSKSCDSNTSSTICLFCLFFVDGALNDLSEHVRFIESQRAQ